MNKIQVEMGMKYYYSIYGYLLESQIPLSHLALKKRAKADFRFSLRPGKPSLLGMKWYHHIYDDDGNLTFSFAKSKRSFLVRMHGNADFSLSLDGKSITCWRNKNLDLPGIEALLLTQAFPLALTLGGHEVLHGGVIKIKKTAVLLLGHQGFGKSTLTLAFINQGYSFLSDDVVPLIWKDEKCYVVPGLKEVRVFPEILKLIFKKTKKNLKTVPAFQKSRLHLKSQFTSRLLPISEIFVLEAPLKRTKKISIERSTPAEAFVALLDNSFRLDLTDRVRMRRELNTLTELVNSVPVRKLNYPRKLNLLPKVIEEIVATL